MKHVVINELQICPKCLKSHMGAAVSVLDFYACTDCFYNKYLNEMEPLMKDKVRSYFSPNFKTEEIKENI